MHGYIYSGINIKSSRMDNGGELFGNEFKYLCKKCSIERKKTTPYTPQ
jgi:hypothetical protein